MTIALTLVSLALLAVSCVAVYLYASRRAARADHDRVAGDLAARERAIEGYLDQIEQQRAALAERDRQLAEHRAKLEGLDDKFRALAQDVLKQANAQFLQLAEQKFKGEQKDATAALEQRKQSIEAMLKPIRESLDKHAKAVGEIEKSREGAYHALRQQIVTMLEGQKELRGETANLVKALRRPEVRGRWGEMQLRRVAELAGMIDNCDFQEQVTGESEAGRLRPDMVVRLPGGRAIVVDAKTPLSAFISAVECTDDQQRDGFLDDHARHIETRVRDLCGKGYQNQFDRSPDFVVLFIPGESFLSAALQRRPDLMESAMNRGVVIATPSTLIALLKAVAMGWREQRIAENARHIAELGQELHERIATATGYVDNLGKHIDNAVKSYNQFVGSYESRVLVSARKFKDLQADSSKELPAEGEVRVIESQPRELRAAQSDS